MRAEADALAGRSTAVNAHSNKARLYTCDQEINLSGDCGGNSGDAAFLQKGNRGSGSVGKGVKAGRPATCCCKARALIFDRQVAEFQVRVAVLTASQCLASPSQGSWGTPETGSAGGRRASGRSPRRWLMAALPRSDGGKVAGADHPRCRPPPPAFIAWRHPARRGLSAHHQRNPTRSAGAKSSLTHRRNCPIDGE
jgi:hypothetical protein